MAATLLSGVRVLAPAAQPAGVDSIGVVDDRIVAVGARRDVATALPADHRRVDVGGRCVAPGFVDAHLHPLPMCFFEHHLDLADATRLADALDLLADRARSTPDGEWALGLRLDDERLAERRLPTRVELDRVGGGRPVVVLRRDGHHAVGSSAALAAAGIHTGTPDPPGGTIHRDADGELSGLCGEAAASLLLSAVPVPPWEALAAALGRVVARLCAEGVTAISAICQTGDVGPSGAAGALEAVAWSAFVEQVPFDVQTILVAGDATQVAAMRATPLHDPAAGRRVDAVKLFLDGTLGGHTACMHEPFADHAGAGMLTLDPVAAYAAMVDAHLADLQVCVHAIGDRANSVAVDLFGRLLDEHPAPHRHRVEHASVVDPSTVERMATLGITAVVQPISIESERPWLAKRLGPERVERVYPYRSLLDAGVVVAGSSDAPIESTGVLAAMRAATDRFGVAAAQAVTVEEALAMYTTGGAWARRTERTCGAIERGRRADLVVLSGDPGRPPATAVDATVAGGRVTFDRLGLFDHLGPVDPMGRT
jgi:predicted amidohydrolase YtcJ